MALDDVYQLTAVQLVGDKEVSNTFYFQETTAQGAPPTQVGNDLSVEFWSAYWRGAWEQIISQALQLSAVFAYRIWPTVAKAGFAAFTGEFGLRGGEAVPNGAAVLVSARDVANTPNFRRRFYFSGLAENDSANSAVVPSARLGWDNFGDILETRTLIPPSLFPGVYTPIAFSKKLAGMPPAIPYAFLASNGVTYPLRSQRGRNPLIAAP